MNFARSFSCADHRHTAAVKGLAFRGVVTLLGAGICAAYGFQNTCTLQLHLQGVLGVQICGAICIHELDHHKGGILAVSLQSLTICCKGHLCILCGAQRELAVTHTAGIAHSLQLAGSVGHTVGGGKIHHSTAAQRSSVQE